MANPTKPKPKSSKMGGVGPKKTRKQTKKGKK